MIPCQRHLFEIPEDVAYLNCAYMSPLMKPAVAAGDRGLRLKSTPWALTIPDFFDPVEEARGLFARLMNVDAEGVAVVPSASYGIATAALNVSVAAGRRIVLLADQFPSHVYSWRKLARENGAEITSVAPGGNRTLTEDVLDAIDERTGIVALPQVLWTNGMQLDLEAVGRKCRDTGAALVLDLTQSAGAMPLDLGAVRPDFAVAATYKWLLGPYAFGFLYVAPEWRDGEPLEQTWSGRANSRNFARLVDYTDAYEPGARRYDMGERANFPLVAATIASLRQILDWGVDEIAETIAAKTAMISARAAAMGLSPTPDHLRGPHFLGVRLPSDAPEDLLTRLAADKVFLSIRGDTLRITPHLYNNEADVDRLMSALARHLGR